MSMVLFWAEEVLARGLRPLPIELPIFLRLFLSDMPVSLDGNTVFQQPGLESVTH